MNSVNIMGRIATDLTLRPVRSSAGVVLNFRVAVDRYAGGGKVTDFIRCTAWGKTAEFIEKYFHKGMKIAIEGRIQTGSYQNQSGQTIYTTDVIAEAVEFVESKNASGNNGGGNSQPAAERPAPQTTDDGWMNIPDGVDEELPFN